MNAVLQLVNNRQKLFRDAACLAADGRLFQRTSQSCISPSPSRESRPKLTKIVNLLLKLCFKSSYNTHYTLCYNSTLTMICSNLMTILLLPSSGRLRSIWALINREMINTLSSKTHSLSVAWL